MAGISSMFVFVLMLTTNVDALESLSSEQNCLDSEEAQRNRVKVLNNKIYKLLYTDTQLYSRRIYERNPNPISVDIFCRKGDEKSVALAWKSAYVEIHTSSNYELYTGVNASEVWKKHDDNKGLLSFSFSLLWKQSQVSFPVFCNYCVGVESKEKYSLRLHEININYWKLLQVLSGILLFVSASNLSRNIIFYYATGISFGLFASFLILVFLISRMTPKKIGAYSFLIFGWSLVLYFLQLIWDNVKYIMESYSHFIYGYIIITTIISAAICYYLGPVTDYKTLNLIQWSLQLIALLLIFLSSEFQELPIVIIITMLLMYFFPKQWIIRFQTIWRRYFPPKVKLLTEAEYINQGNEETRNALEALRKHCHSPECNPWKTICKVKDPIRFAKFVEGDSHLSDQEILDYDSESMPNFAEDAEVTESSSDEDIQSNHIHLANSYQPSLSSPSSLFCSW